MMQKTSPIKLDRHGAVRLAMTSLRGGESDEAIQSWVSAQQTILQS
jgi:hypothetical protein